MIPGPPWNPALPRYRPSSGIGRPRKPFGPGRLGRIWSRAALDEWGDVSSFTANRGRTAFSARELTLVDATETDVSRLPLVPRNPQPRRQQLTAARQYHIGQELLRQAGGPVTRVALGPRWLSPPIVFVMSPTGARDVLARNNEWGDRTLVHRETRRLMGDNLADLPNTLWRSRKRTLQPVFTRQHVGTFGGHMSCPKPPP